jgi:mercury(II) reductase
MGRLNLSPNDIYNDRLLNNVHPEDWINPEPEPIYNLVVIGAGTAGLISAIATASLGGKVALIEKDLMGGDCLNVGCVPSKSIIKSARVAHIIKNAEKYGFENHTFSSLDFEKIMERMRKIRADISHNDSVKRYSELGVNVFLGKGHFVGDNSIEVDGKILKFKKAVIATGARAVAPNIPGLKESGYLTNENIFNLQKLPGHLLVIGGGPIGCELAQSFKRFGAKVTIVQHSRILPREDIEAASIIEDVLKNDGVEILTNSKVAEVKLLENGKKLVTVQTVDGSSSKNIEIDEILAAAGRAPNVEGLNLDMVNVDYDLREGVKVNDYLQTTNKNIYAAGDCCMKWKFTHAADAAAQIVIQNALFKGRKRLSSLVMPWCTYTDPEVAHVGMYKEEAVSQGIEVEHFKFDMNENDRAQADGETIGFVKVMVKKGTDKILGATIVAAHAGEMINEFTIAIVNNIGLGKLANVIHPYPTQSEAIKRVSGLYNKSRLTPRVAKILKWWFKFQRR